MNKWVIVVVFLNLSMFSSWIVTPVSAAVGDLQVDVSSGGSIVGTNVSFARFVDSANNSYYIDPASATTSINVAGNISIGLADSTDDVLYFDGSTESITWSESNTRFELTDDLEISDSDPELKLEDSTTNHDDFSLEVDADEFFIQDVSEATVRLTIDDDGNVGIGGVPSANQLFVQENQVNMGTLRLRDGSNSLNDVFVVEDGGTTSMKSTMFGTVFTCTGGSGCVSSDTGSWTVNTTEASTNNGTLFNVLGTGTGVSTFYMGLDHPFSTAWFDLEVGGVGGTISKEYWNGSAWTALSGVSDGTTNLTVGGTMTWTVPSNWAAKTVNSTSAYWVRLRSTTNLTTSPQTRFVSPTNSSVAVFSVYAQNGDASPAHAVFANGRQDFWRKGFTGSQVLSRFLTDDAAAANEYFNLMYSDFDGTPDIEFSFATSGQANADTAFTGGGADVAELYYLEGALEEGDLVMIPQQLHSGNPIGQTVTKSKGKPYDPIVVGVVSTNPGLVAGAGNIDIYMNKVDPRKPIALAGRVPVKVNLENGPIRKGDPLTSSMLPGVAMKATSTGKILGYALEDYHGTVSRSEGVRTVEDERLDSSPDVSPIPLPQNGVGKIMMYVQAGWHDPTHVIPKGVTIDSISGTYVAKADGAVVKTIQAFSEVTAARVDAGRIEAKNMIIGGTNLEQKLRDLENRFQRNQEQLESLKAKL